ncbi:RidA family protein [Bordetella avium]|nr:RidA family protein [Bordetella avium]RIQ35097.1 RidA family protein [Bordetella avium]
MGTDIYVSGLDRQTGMLAGDGEQTRCLFLHLQALCEEQGGSIERIVWARVYCAGVDAVRGMNEAWGAFCDEIEPPARTW